MYSRITSFSQIKIHPQRAGFQAKLKEQTLVDANKKFFGYQTLTSLGAKVCLIFLKKDVLIGEALVTSWFGAAVPKGWVISSVSSSRTLYSKPSAFLWLYILMVGSPIVTV